VNYKVLAPQFKKPGSFFMITPYSLPESKNVKKLPFF
jgi:hypothetical protein